MWKYLWGDLMSVQKKKTVHGLEVPCGPNGISVITVLQAIQAHYGYLPREPLIEAAREMNLPLVDLYSVATFYKTFSLVPRGEHEIISCTGTACHVRGAEKVTEEISQALGVEIGSTTEDGQYSLKCVNCVGACALAPVVIADGQYYGQMTPLKARKLFDKASVGNEQPLSPSAGKV